MNHSITETTLVSPIRAILLSLSHPRSMHRIRMHGRTQGKSSIHPFTHPPIHPSIHPSVNGWMDGWMGVEGDPHQPLLGIGDDDMSVFATLSTRLPRNCGCCPSRDQWGPHLSHPALFSSSILETAAARASPDKRIPPLPHLITTNSPTKKERKKEKKKERKEGRKESEANFKHIVRIPSAILFIRFVPLNIADEIRKAEWNAEEGGKEGGGGGGGGGRRETASNSCATISICFDLFQCVGADCYWRVSKAECRGNNADAIQFTWCRLSTPFQFHGSAAMKFNYLGILLA